MVIIPPEVVRLPGANGYRIQIIANTVCRSNFTVNPGTGAQRHSRGRRKVPQGYGYSGFVAVGHIAYRCRLIVFKQSIVVVAASARNAQVYRSGTRKHGNGHWPRGAGGGVPQLNRANAAILIGIGIDIHIGNRIAFEANRDRAAQRNRRETERAQAAHIGASPAYRFGPVNTDVIAVRRTVFYPQLEPDCSRTGKRVFLVERDCPVHGSAAAADTVHIDFTVGRMPVGITAIRLNIHPRLLRWDIGKGNASG